jgi:hypothetical protein
VPAPDRSGDQDQPDRRRETGGRQGQELRGGKNWLDASQQRNRPPAPTGGRANKTTGAPTPIVSPLLADCCCVDITRIAANELTPI